MTKTVFKAYYSALKPERTYANVMTAAAGFLFACRWHIDWQLFASTIVGTTLIVMSACAANNATDRGIDARMPRTQKRPTVTGEVPVRNVAWLAAVLGIAGFGLLLAYVNGLTALIGAIAYLDYVVLYGYSKRHSVHSTVIGTISGAAPLVAGYTAVTGQFDLTALVLGLIMVFWQMPHFYAIGIFRRDDYAAADLPIWPVRYGVRSTQRWMLGYTLLYLLTVLWLGLVGSAGIIYLSLTGLLGLYWLYIGVKGFGAQRPEKWARGMFGFSLINLLALSGILTVARIIP